MPCEVETLKDLSNALRAINDLDFLEEHKGSGSRKLLSSEHGELIRDAHK